MARGKTQAAANFGLHLLEGPGVSAPGGELHTMVEYHPITSMIGTLKGQAQGAPVCPCTADTLLWSLPVLVAK